MADASRRDVVAALRKFFRTPKGLLTIVLVILVAIAAPGEGLRLVAPGLASAVLAAALIDVVILRLRRQRGAKGSGDARGLWEFPSGAILTGLIVAMVLSPQEPWYVTGCISAVAIISKYLVRTRSANVFNPAAVAIVVTFYVFDTGQNWWGALPEAPPIAMSVLFATGVFIANRVNKIPLVLAFLGSYYLLFTLTAYFGDPRRVAEIYRTPDLQAALFFAFFILTDPPTSPVKYPDQIVCGVMVAVVSFGIFEWIGAAYYLLAGVLVGNVWEGWRRWRVRKDRDAARTTSRTLASMNAP